MNKSYTIGKPVYVSLKGATLVRKCICRLSSRCGVQLWLLHRFHQTDYPRLPFQLSCTLKMLIDVMLFPPFLIQNLISAATGMNLTTVDDPIQRKFLPSFLRGVAEENKLVTSPNFVVTQALVALLADKGARLRPAYDKADMEKRGL